jgi:hypothetical protein
VGKEPDRAMSMMSSGGSPELPPVGEPSGRLGDLLLRLVGACGVAVASGVALLAAFTVVYEHDGGDVSGVRQAVAWLLFLLALGLLFTAGGLVIRAVAKALPSRDEADS